MDNSFDLKTATISDLWAVRQYCESQLALELDPESFIRFSSLQIRCRVEIDERIYGELHRSRVIEDGIRVMRPINLS